MNFLSNKPKKPERPDYFVPFEGPLLSTSDYWKKTRPFDWDLITPKERRERYLIRVK